MWAYTVIFGALTARGMANTKEEAEKMAKAIAKKFLEDYPEAPFTPVVEVHELPNPPTEPMFINEDEPGVMDSIPGEWLG